MKTARARACAFGRSTPSAAFLEEPWFDRVEVTIVFSDDVLGRVVSSNGGRRRGYSLVDPLDQKPVAIRTLPSVGRTFWTRSPVRTASNPTRRRRPHPPALRPGPWAHFWSSYAYLMCEICQDPRPTAIVGVSLTLYRRPLAPAPTILAVSDGASERRGSGLTGGPAVVRLPRRFTGTGCG